MIYDFFVLTLSYQGQGADHREWSCRGRLREKSDISKEKERSNTFFKRSHVGGEN